VVLEALTGTGLAASAGLNAYIPLLSVGLLTRYTDAISLPSEWQWLENPWVLSILGILLTIEFIADKIPAVDHVNDVLQTVVRPTRREAPRRRRSPTRPSSSRRTSGCRWSSAS
jgi:hypothetical protein